MLFLKTFVLCLIGLGVADAVWLGVMSSRLYAPMMGALLRPDPVWLPGLCFYLVFAIGLSQLVVMPALMANRAKSQNSPLVLNAALFGLAAYGTYDLSAWAVIKNWPWLLSLIDIGWGVFVSVVTAALAYFLLKQK